GVILQTAGILLQYTFWQFLTPISSSFVRNPGLVPQGLFFSSKAPVLLRQLTKKFLSIGA
ncbi:MAG: hypothetical protein V7K94_30355, partial [Nostoc sp.]|uniref:hypothetical protein n=1 Tax=Nostoc sp. TaxID=1180 RepID=UPI002FFB78DB